MLRLNETCFCDFFVFIIQKPKIQYYQTLSPRWKLQLYFATCSAFSKLPILSFLCILSNEPLLYTCMFCCRSPKLYRRFANLFQPFLLQWSTQNLTSIYLTRKHEWAAQAVNPTASVAPLELSDAYHHVWKNRGVRWPCHRPPCHS